MDFADFCLDLSEHVEEMLQHLRVHVLEHAADLVHRKDDPAAGRQLDQIQNFFADAPALVKQAFKAEGVGHQPQPQQVAVKPGGFAPNRPQVFGARRHLDVHDLLYRLAIAHAVLEAADAAGPFRDVDHFFEVPLVDEALEAAVNEAHRRDDPDDLFVVEHQIQMDRLRQHGMLGPEGHDVALVFSRHHSSSLSGPKGVFSSMR